MDLRDFSRVPRRGRGGPQPIECRLPGRTHPLAVLRPGRRGDRTRCQRGGARDHEGTAAPGARCGRGRVLLLPLGVAPGRLRTAGAQPGGHPRRDQGSGLGARGVRPRDVRGHVGTRSVRRRVRRHRPADRPPGHLGGPDDPEVGSGVLGPDHPRDRGGRGFGVPADLLLADCGAALPGRSGAAGQCAGFRRDPLPPPRRESSAATPRRSGASGPGWR